MIVIAHLAVGMAYPVIDITDLFQQLKKLLAILVIFKYGLAAVTA
jgi:hypothetical protein